MRFAAVLLVAFAYSGALASEPGQPAPTEPPVPAAAPKSKATAAVRQSEDADLIVKEWHSPITFEVDANWLAALPMGTSKEIKDIPSFFCDNATLESMTVTKRRPRPGVTRLTFDFTLSVQSASHDKMVELELSLLNGDARLPFGRDSDLQVAEGRSMSTWVWYEYPDPFLARYMTEGPDTRIRISMVVRND